MGGPGKSTHSTAPNTNRSRSSQNTSNPLTRPTNDSARPNFNTNESKWAILTVRIYVLLVYISIMNI